MTTLELAQTAKKIIDRKKPQSEQETVLPLAVPEKPPQQLAQNVPGNIDLSQRPSVKNADGTTSTVRSMSFNEDGQEILVPTVVGNRVVSDEDAIRNYHKQGQHLGKFNSVDDANAAGDAIHRQQEIRGIGGWPQAQMAPIQRDLDTPMPTPIPQPSMAGMNPGNELVNGLRRVRPDLFKPPQQPSVASPGPNPEMVKIESQLNAMDEPPAAITLADRAKSALRGLGMYGGMNPVQAQQLEANSRQADADNQFRRRQELAQRAKAIMDKEHRDTQDARQRGVDYRDEQFQNVQTRNIEDQIRERNEPKPRNIDPLSPEGVAAQQQIQPPPAPRNIDPNSPEGIEARLKFERNKPRDTTANQPNTPFEAWRQQNPKAPIDDWFKVSNAKSGRATVAETKAMGFFDRIYNAKTAIDSMEAEINKLGLGGQTRLTNAPNWLQSPVGKRFNQAAGEFINAALRRESGAAISEVEYKRFGKIYFPQPGDDEPTLKQKAQSRQAVLDSLKREAGSAYSNTYDDVDGGGNVDPLGVR